MDNDAFLEAGILEQHVGYGNRRITTRNRGMSLKAESSSWALALTGCPSDIVSF
jgi:hypothetical protein